MDSLVGLALYISTAGNFRKITFSRPDWTMVIMSDPKSLLKYPHTSSRQSRRRTNKRKRVSGDCFYKFWLVLGGCLLVFRELLLVEVWEEWKSCFWQVSERHSWKHSCVNQSQVPPCRFHVLSAPFDKLSCSCELDSRLESFEVFAHWACQRLKMDILSFL